jgi:lipopolysaccharide biosynthesis glycosyltransferase
MVSGRSSLLHVIDIVPIRREARGVRTPVPLPLVWQKLVLASLLPQDLTRVLYLDADTIVRKSLWPLWGERTAEHAVIRAVQDFGSPAGDHFRRDARFVEAWAGSDYSYFNAGMMIVELEAWRTLYVALFISRHTVALDNRCHDPAI